MTKIDEHTYEAVYLDFLEGNLSEPEIAMFLRFLEANPLLKLDDELVDYTRLVPPKIELEASFKAELTFFSEDGAINEQSIHHFLIAEVEGCLSVSKLEELHAFIVANSCYKQERDKYTLTRIQIGEKIVFDEKQSLKKQQHISLFNYIIYAAACVLFFVFLLKGIQTERYLTLKPKAQQTSKKRIKHHEEFSEKFQTAKNETTTQPLLQVNTPSDVSIKKQMMTYQKLTPRELVLLPLTTDLTGIEFHTQKEMKSETDRTNQPMKRESMFGRVKNYKNPIKPITSLVSVIFRKTVDIRMDQKTLQQSDYLFIKIGRLQVYRQKRTDNNEGLICFKYD